MTDKWFEAEDVARDVLLSVTALIPHDEAQGIALAVGLALAGAAINAAYAVEQTVKLPFRVFGIIK